MQGRRVDLTEGGKGLLLLVRKQAGKHVLVGMPSIEDDNLN